MPLVPSGAPSAVSALEARHAALQGALFESIVAATPPGPRARLGLRYEQRGSLGVVACDADPHLMLNRVVQLSGAARVPAGELSAALERVRAPTRADHCLVQLSAEADTGELERLGLTPFRRDWQVLARSLAPAPTVSTRFRLAPAAASHASAFGEILAAAFDMSDAYVPAFAGLLEHGAWHCSVALDGERVVAAAGLFVHEASAYLGFAATRPSHRGAGAHDALIARRIEQARRLGCDALLTETGAPVPGEPSPSLNNMLTAGFEPVFVRKNFAPAGTTWTGHARDARSP